MEEINFKSINTENLWHSFKDDMDNLSIVEGELRLDSTHIYDFGMQADNTASLDMKDIAVDECDLIYIIDTGTKAILTYEKDSNSLKGIGALPLALDLPSGIGIDYDTIYIADKQRLIALARSNLQVRWILSKDSNGIPLNELIDLTVFGNDIYILEGEADREKRILKINRAGGIISQPVSLEEESRPSDMAVDNDGDIYVLDLLDGISVVRIFRKERTETISTGFLAKGLAVDVNRQMFVGVSADDTRKERTIYKLGLDGTAIPIWSYRDAARRLITDSKSNLHVIDCNGDKLVFLKYKKINSLNRAGLYSGYYISKPIDSNDRKTRWHRFLLEGRFEEGTQIEFSYYISNEPQDERKIKLLPESSWHRGLPGTSSIQGTEKRDALFQKDILGRYLWFKINLTGSETLSPTVKSLTVFFPRMSYLDYLPAIYQEDPVSKEFLERFLSIFESIFYEIDFNIEHLARLFDAYGTPPEFISWLSSWLAIPVDEDFSEKMKRLYLHRAVSLYKKRGTREGLEEAIALFIYTKKYPDKGFEDIITHYRQEKPFIVENFRINREKQCKSEPPQNVKLLFFPPDDAMIAVKKLRSVRMVDGTPNIREEVPLSDVLYGKNPFCFCVFLDNKDMNESTLNTVKRIIEEQKPAHTCYGLKVLEPWFYLDMHTYLEINTSLTMPAFILEKASVIGRDTVLYDTEPSGQVRVHSRIGVDTKLT